MLSNKLTFSLALVVMLVFGLAFMATPAYAGKYSATSAAGTTWTINIYFPVTEADVEFAAGTVTVATPTITQDGTTGALTGIEFVNATVASGGLTTRVAQRASDTGADADTPAASTEFNARFAHYRITATRTAADDTTTDAVDEGVITFTVDGYIPVNLRVNKNDDGTEDLTTAVAINLTDLATPVEIEANSVDFTIDPSVSSFAIIYNSASADPDTDDEGNEIPGTGYLAGERLGNGIRLGDSYVPEAATFGRDLPDLASFFNQGGTIKIIDDGNSPVVSSGVFITEVMWGYDAEDGIGAPSSDDQWIEVYYTAAETATTTPAAINLRLVFVYSALDEGGIDHVSNLYLAKWAPKGQSGRTQYSALDGSAPIPIVSMYRKRGIIVGGVAESEYNPTANFAANGKYPGSWEVSGASVNMQGFFTGTPGAAHLTPTVGGGHADYAKSEIPGTPLQISEVRNDNSVDNVDWIELRNVSDGAVNLKDYELSLVTGVSRSTLKGKKDARGRDVRNYGNLTADKKEPLEHDLAIVGEDKYFDGTANDVKRFPDWELPAGAYLVIVNRDPSETILASGKNIEVLADQNVDDKTTNKGTGFYYFVTPHLRFSNSGGGTPLLVLRNRVDRNEYQGKVHGDGASIIDMAGAGRHPDPSALFNTEVWPLKGWKNPGGSPNIANAGVWNFVKDGNHEWWKTDGVANNLVGYDKDVNPQIAVGSPGYPNNVVKDKAADVMSDASQPISISEIMFDASVHAGNERWNLVQWIELYNSSMTEAVNLKDWEFIIQNSNDHVDSYVDSSFRFNDLIIHPNQTVLLVSARASSGGVADRQIYNLYTHHARVLGLANRRANLLSPAGFYLKLVDKANEVVDEAGNVTVNGRQRTTADWEAMPPSEGPVRYSLVRQYGTRAEDGDGPDDPAVGTMEEAWILADLDGEGSTYFGQRGDIATPGFRTGGPLPVSLSSFRPVRDKATGEVVIRWITQSELNNAGFNILRSETKNGEFKVVNLKGLIRGHGTTSEKHVYEWKDTTAKPNVVYYYQIEDVSFEGQRTTLATTHLRGNVNAAGKVTTTWGDLKTQ